MKVKKSVHQEIIEKYPYLMILSKTRSDVYYGDGASWFVQAKMKRDFGENGYQVFSNGKHPLHRQASSAVIDKMPELKGHILGFAVRSDVLRFKLAISNYIRIKNYKSTFIIVNQNVLFEINELQKLWVEYKIETSKTTPIEKWMNEFSAFQYKHKLNDKTSIEFFDSIKSQFCDYKKILEGGKGDIFYKKLEEFTETLKGQSKD
jgi:hypothetical protein